MNTGVAEFLFPHTCRMLVTFERHVTN